MRLKSGQVSAIKNTILDFLPSAELYLYGSRLDDEKKGGDIDLLIKVDREPERAIKSKIKSGICGKIGEQKIDLIFDYPGNENSFIELIKLDMEKL